MWPIRQLSVESGSMRMSSSSVKIGLANLPEGRGESTKWSISPCLHPKVSSFDNRFLILRMERRGSRSPGCQAPCLLYTSDAADDLLCVDLGGRRIIKKK